MAMLVVMQARISKKSLLRKLYFFFDLPRRLRDFLTATGGSGLISFGLSTEALNPVGSGCSLFESKR
jgi:hypothetical protein